LPLEPFQFGAFEGKEAGRIVRLALRLQPSKSSQGPSTFRAPVIARVEAWQDLEVTASRQVFVHRI
jgi:hypothetical protein